MKTGGLQTKAEVAALLSRWVSNISSCRRLRGEGLADHAHGCRVTVLFAESLCYSASTVQLGMLVFSSCATLSGLCLALVLSGKLTDAPQLKIAYAHLVAQLRSDAKETAGSLTNLAAHIIGLRPSAAMSTDILGLYTRLSFYFGVWDSPCSNAALAKSLPPQHTTAAQHKVSPKELLRARIS
eukprot:5594232-Amphidinium_carterae.2